jgi:hypothetical protein
MRKKRFKNYLLILLALLFAAPGVSAYFFYKHPEWLGGSFVNKGTFIQPPQHIRFNKTPGKWAIVFWSPKTCEQPCMERVNLLARVRLALGRKLYEVEQWLMLGEPSSLGQAAQALLKEEDVRTAQLSLSQYEKLRSLSATVQVFLVNPDRYFILSYPEQVNPNDVYSDLKRLLDSTQPKSR